MTIEQLEALERAADEANGGNAARMIARWKYVDAAVNALPALLAVAKAAKAYRDCGDDIPRFEETYKALCEAISRLEAQ